MNILHYETNNRQYYLSLLTTIQRAAKAATSEYDFLVPRGWQLIVKMKSDEETYFHLHLQEGAGGSYAAAKMSTLEKFPEQAYTGADATKDILYMLEQLEKDDHDIVDEIVKAESPAHLTKIQREWLRDTCGIASMYGGIRIPYEFLINADEPQNAEGEILITFSGASQEQDVFFATWLLGAIQETLTRTQENIQHDYDLTELRKNPVINHWLKIMRVHSYDR